MENSEPKKSTEGQEGLEDYEDEHKELFAWIDEEKRKENPHVSLINRDLISPELVDLFSKFRKGDLTAEEFVDTRTLYFSNVWESLTREQKDSNDNFLSMMANKLNSPEDTLERLKNEGVN